MSVETPWRDESTLRELYHGRGMTLEEMSDRLGVTKQCVWKWMERHGVERRAYGPTAPPYFETTRRGYERWSHDIGVFRYKIYVHRLLAVVEYGLDGVAGKDIHHKNGIPWDNRMENIEPMTRKDHMEVHGRIEQMNGSENEHVD